MRKNNQSGFSLIEILMVLILIAVLAAIAINAFINFRGEARTAALAANLSTMRTAISTQYAQMQLRCGSNPGTFPPAANVAANDIVTPASDCAAGEVTILSERNFVQGGWPNNPYGTDNDINTCVDCTPTTADGTFCDGTAVATNEWCYDPATGRIWADTAAMEEL